ncbi:hypothetical protein [Sporomusa malonica]|uniref:Uncharacterized protein n=1 Tax=Sporomusa malonica TaxID=112901 RepID=A0A1W2E0A5_9FIRM|nr:hypothetical protein [Sporomusa malonica]SMD03170.1 hypothetical protein SAMN04488500_11970 [Sporomusa malonica]
MFVWHEIFGVPPAVITIVGMAKNVGKTVTLNYIQKMFHNEGWVLGLTSIGRDGETFDALTNIAKPLISVQPGIILATAEKVITEPAGWEYLQDTDFKTPLGKVIILRAKSLNKVVLAGPSKNREIQELLQSLAAWGAQCILIDGAFDRQSSADPLVSNQVILATGATVSRDLTELIHATQSRVEQLTLPACSQFYRELSNKSQAKVLIVNAGVPREMSLTTSLLRPVEWSELFGLDCDAVIVKGAVGDGLAQALLRQLRPPKIIVQDASKIFVNPNLWRQLKDHHVQFSAVQTICLLGVTINPTYPGGKGFDAEEILQKMGKVLSPMPVLDIMREAKFK